MVRIKTIAARLTRRRPNDEAGSMLVELLIALTFLAVAVGALVSVYASSYLSLRHTSIEGNALTVVDQRMEALKAVSYDTLGLDASTIPSSGDAYVSSPPNNLTSTQRAGITSGQVTGGSYTATQTVSGPDKRIYRVDTYIFSATPSQGRNVVQVTVSARLVVNGTPGTVRAQATSAFDAASSATAS